MKRFLMFLFDILVPRFVEERVAMYRDERNNWQILCIEDDLNEDDIYECIGVARSFVFLVRGCYGLEN